MTSRMSPFSRGAMFPVRSCRNERRLGEKKTALWVSFFFEEALLRSSEGLIKPEPLASASSLPFSGIGSLRIGSLLEERTQVMQKEDVCAEGLL